MNNEHPLVLFSVIVALAPLKSNLSSNDSNIIHTPNNNYFTTDKTDNAQDSTFTTIECIHRNLARLCNVLTREERRCQYVTLQCQMLLTVRKEYEDRLLPTTKDVKSNNNASKADESNISKPTRRVSNTPSSVPNTKGGQAIPTDKRTVLQTPSNKEDGKSQDIYSPGDNEGEKQISRTERREYIQQLIDLMFASSPPKSNHGNLARELAEVFHFFSRHDDPAAICARSSNAPAALSRAVGKDIYINQHVAVPFDSMNVASTSIHEMSLSTTLACPTNDEIVQPHQTLLFPNLSASEVLRALSDETTNLSFSVGSAASATDTSTSVSMSHAIRRMLTQLHPRKTLKEVASDSALSVHQGTNIMSYYALEFI